MKTATTSILLPCTPETFWSVFLDERYLTEFYLDELAYKAFSIIEIGESSRKLRIVPKMKVPAVLGKLIGDSFAFEDHGTLNRSRTEWAWRVVQPAQLNSRRKARKDAVKMQGTICIEAEGDAQCRRTDEFSIEANIFGVGSRIETSVEKELQSVREKEYAFLTQWLER